MHGRRSPIYYDKTTSTRSTTIRDMFDGAGHVLPNICTAVPLQFPQIYYTSDKDVEEDYELQVIFRTNCNNQQSRKGATMMLKLLAKNFKFYQQDSSRRIWVAKRGFFRRYVALENCFGRHVR